MNKEWSEKNLAMQSLLKRDTFAEGISELTALRETLMKEILSWKGLSKEDFCAQPFMNAKGYHSKTIAYSLWHIFRIEDIVVNSLICREDEVLFRGAYAQKIRSPIITTGNELKGREIAEFSQNLEIDALYQYLEAVAEKTDGWLRTLEYSFLKKGFDESDKERLRKLAVVSSDADAVWLIDYWCGRDIRGLIKMPLSRHWIMHVEAALRIMDQLGSK